MPDNAFDALVIDVRRRFRSRQDILRIEDVERLVLHRPHVEVVGGDDVVNVEVVLQAETVLVPLHRVLQRFHGVLALVLVAVLDVEAKADLSPASGLEKILHAGKVACHEREKITGLGKGIVPANPVAPVVQHAGTHGIAVREQHRVAFPVGHDGHLVTRHHVRAVRKIGDLAKPLGLALRQQEITGRVQSFQRGILLRADQHFDAEPARRRRVMDHQRVRIQRERVGIETAVIQEHRHQFHVLSVQLDVAAAARPFVCPAIRVTAEVELRPDPGRLETDFKTEGRLFHLPWIRCVFLAKNRFAGGAFHHERSCAGSPVKKSGQGGDFSRGASIIGPPV